MEKVFLLLCFAFFTLKAQDVYYPPLDNSQWEIISPESLNWDTDKINELYSFLETNNTKAFLVLKNGRIVLEKYFGEFTQDSLWYWASAGKTLTAALVGIAQEEGYLSIYDRTSKFLGNGWTSCPTEKEYLITIRHQLTMTTGLNDRVADPYCTNPECLIYKANAGTRWAYHNAPYTLLEKVVENATGQDFNVYFHEKIKTQIGMNGLWVKSGFNNVYISNARSMAKFGILLLGKGMWNNKRIIPENYYYEMVNTSQELNKSYGYLFWLNGKESYMLPRIELVLKGSLLKDAPDDVIAALGKDGQILNVSPNSGIIVVRMGSAPNQSDGEIAGQLNNEIWKFLNSIINQSSSVQNELENKFAIKPNPASDYIEIYYTEYPNGFFGNQIEIYNMMGECLLNEKVQGLGFMCLNIRGLPVGIYILKIGKVATTFVKITDYNY